VPSGLAREFASPHRVAWRRIIGGRHGRRDRIRAAQAPSALFDLAILNARIIDGTGAPARQPILEFVMDGLRASAR
jgi:hypothetical protein